MRSVALFVTAVGRINTFVGRTFAWLVPVAVLICFAVVVQRYVLSATQLWLQDLYVWLNGAMFMAVAGYTLLIDSHVRVDILYRPATVRRKAIIDLVGVLLFLLPFALSSGSGVSSTLGAPGCFAKARPTRAACRACTS